MSCYRSYDREALEAQYNLRRRVPEHVDFLARWAADSETARRTLPCRLDLRYGEDDAAATADVFPAALPDAPVLLFIHGGYWRTLDKGDFSFLAPPWVTAGATFAAINYPLAPQAPMDRIVACCRQAVAWARREFAGPLFLAGHSAGAHLAAMALIAEPAAGACLLSGVYDLAPVRLVPYVNDDLGLDEATAVRNSPLHQQSAEDIPLVVGVGADETEEFVRQSRCFAVDWGADVYVEMPGRHHFSAVDALADADSLLFGAVLDLIDGRLNRER